MATMATKSPSVMRMAVDIATSESDENEVITALAKEAVTTAAIQSDGPMSERNVNVRCRGRVL